MPRWSASRQSRWHGVAANAVARLPKAEHTVLETENGFDSGPLVAEPIWEAAARAGKLGRDGRALKSIRVTVAESPVARAWYEASLW